MVGSDGGTLRRRASHGVVENTVLPRSYLYSAFFVQSNNLNGDVCIADSSASCHMTHQTCRVGRQHRCCLPQIHARATQLTLVDISYSLHAVERTRRIILVAHGIGTNATFPRISCGSHLRATRLPAGTIRAEKWTRDIRENTILNQLCHPVPPPPLVKHQNSIYMTGISFFSNCFGDRYSA